MSKGQININLGDSNRPAPRRRIRIIWFLVALLIGAGGSRYISNKHHDRKTEKVRKVLLENQRALQVRDSIIADLEDRRSANRDAYESEIEELKETLTLERSKKIIEKVYVPSVDPERPTITIDEGQAEAIVLDRKELEYLRVEIVTCNDLVGQLQDKIEILEDRVTVLSREKDRQARKARRKRNWKYVAGLAAGFGLCAILKCGKNKKAEQ